MKKCSFSKRFETVVGCTVILLVTLLFVTVQNAHATETTITGLVTTRQFLGGDDTLVIEEEGEINVEDGEAVMIQGNNNRLTNNGTITHDGFWDRGIQIFNSSSNTIINNGTITSGTGQNTWEAISSDYTSDSNTVTNNGTILTEGSGAHAIEMKGENDIITNNGTITTEREDSDGISSSGAGSTITNNGTITTEREDSYGIFLTGTGSTVTNTGTIITTNPDDSSYSISRGIFSIASGSTVTNTGTITSTGLNSRGITSNGSGSSSGYDSTVINTGSIRVIGNGSLGIKSSTFSFGSFFTTQTINNYGFISATGEDSYAILGESGNETLNLFCGSQVTGTIDLGGGTDTVNIYSGDSCQDPSTLDIRGAEIINYAPVANAGDNQQVFTGKLVFLDGTASSDHDGVSLTYKWAFTSIPSGSKSILYDDTSMSPTFIPDIMGTYELSLTVNDGTMDDIDNMTVTAYTEGGLKEAVINAHPAISDLSRSAFKKPQYKGKDTFYQKLWNIYINIGYRPDISLNRLNNFLKRMDGCATIGEPDNNDWIIDCDAQKKISSILLLTAEN